MAAINIWGDTDQETWGPWTGKWLVHIHGDEGIGEISIVRVDFKHGFRSLGWDGKAKYIVKKHGKPVSPELWEAMVKMAGIFAEELNKLDETKC